MATKEDTSIRKDNKDKLPFYHVKTFKESSKEEEGFTKNLLK